MPVNGVWGETVNGIAVCGNGFIVSAWGGVFRLSGDGATWTSCNYGLSPGRYSKIAVSGDTIYVASDDLFRSTDFGETWTDLNAVTASYTNVYSLGITGGMIIINLANMRDSVFFTTFISTDNGENWSKADSSLDISPSCFATSGSAILCGGSGGISRSVDNGQTWDSVLDVSVNAIVSAEKVVLAGTRGNDIWRSTDNGLNWTKVYNCAGTGSVNDFAFFKNKVIAGSTFGTYCSYDTGKTWEEVDSPPVAISSFGFNGSTLLAGTESGTFISTDNGESWSAINAGLAAGTIKSLAVCGSNIIAGTTNGIYFSGNNGTDWSGSHPSIPILSLAVMKNKVFAGLGRYPLEFDEIARRYISRKGGVLCGTKYGTTWSYVESFGLPNEAIIDLQASNHYDLTCLAVQDSALFGVYHDSLYRSGDYGTNWSSVMGTSTAVYAAGDNTLFAGGSNGIFRSADKGANWTAVNTGLTHTNVRSIVSNASHVFAGTTGGGVFRSGDNGENWEACGSGLTDTAITALAVYGDALFAGTKSKGVFLSTDNGLHWTDVGMGLSVFYPVTSFAVNNEVLFAGTFGTGLWQRPLSEMLGTMKIRPQRIQYDRMQKATGMIRSTGSTVAVEFTLPQPDKVTVALYDMAGRVVAFLFSKHLEAGAYCYSWSTRTFTRGCYVASVQACKIAFRKIIHPVN
ncbi:MAG: hypothetical protein JW768_15320 [Chitinispirillaceae bacterium]|nr:hypothetical protein [Chitinispirillaceae bacterium]